MAQIKIQCSTTSPAQEVCVPQGVLPHSGRIVFCRVKVLPDTGGKDMLILVVPSTINHSCHGWIIVIPLKDIVRDLAWLLLLLSRNGQRVILLSFLLELCCRRTVLCRLCAMREEWSTEATSPIRYEIVELIMLLAVLARAFFLESRHTCMRYNNLIPHEHQVINSHPCPFSSALVCS